LYSNCEALSNVPCAGLQIPKILNDVFNTSFADWKNEHQLLGCDAAILANDGNDATFQDEHLWQEVMSKADGAMLFLFQKSSHFSPSD
jgi:hypothetical protein